MGRKKNFDPELARREYEEALERTNAYIESAKRSLEDRDSATASGYIFAAAEMLGLALGHLQYMEQVGPEVFGRYRGLRDQLDGLQASLRRRLFDPGAELRFNPKSSQARKARLAGLRRRR